MINKQITKSAFYGLVLAAAIGFGVLNATIANGQEIDIQVTRVEASAPADEASMDRNQLVSYWEMNYGD